MCLLRNNHLVENYTCSLLFQIIRTINAPINVVTHQFNQPILLDFCSWTPSLDVFLLPRKHILDFIIITLWTSSWSFKVTQQTPFSTKKIFSNPQVIQSIEPSSNKSKIYQIDFLFLENFTLQPQKHLNIFNI